ncbi:MAG: autotransporter-associated beta strand repeat-containing protein [Akkermansia sp.]|nr:autotransporter-associated beta strand repeat-containing protein [Akkermansia sp.]
MEDGAIYKGNGINVAAGSGATLRLDNGTLNQAGYSVEMNASTTLDLQRVNSIAATTLDMKDGSALSFTLGEENLTTAALTLTGALNQGGALTISLADDGTMERENKYALLKTSSGTTPETWDVAMLTIEGLDATVSDLSWSNGTLYFTYPMPDLATATWSGAQSRVWNTTDKNWTQGEYNYAYKDGVDVVFGDAGSGSVRLDGSLAPKSVLVENTAYHDYVLESSGKLSGATSLTKNGEGKLTINTANDYTGGTVLNGGTLVAGSGTALGVGAIQISNGTLDLGGNSLANDISALNADTIVRNGSLTGDFTMTGGSLDASELHIETQALNVTASGEVSFHNAGGATSGGAVYGGEYSIISLKDNEAVTFSENNADAGGAVFGAFNTINLEGNAAVTFWGNYSSSYNGGAIYGYGNTINLEGNAAVTFSGNTSSYLGGAIYGGNSIIRMKDNEVVTFTGNSANDGGAICGECDSVIFEGNAVVTFSGNSAHRGGAIYTYGISMLGNDSVSFSGNYEKTESGDSLTYRLRSVYMAGGTLTLAAGEGQDIMFYDTLYAAEGTVVSFNDDFTDKKGVTQKGTGDIVFSSKFAEQNLRELKEDFTQQELTDSLTTEVYVTTNLYGGRLRIEDGAIYKGNGINAAAGSNATLRLAGGTLEQAGYDVLLNAGTTLDLAGSNSITASTLEMMDGSTLSFNAGATEGVMLNLDAALKTGDLHVTVSGDLTKEYALLQLSDVSQYDFAQWNSGQVSVSGTDYEHLIWKDGVLTYKPWESTHTDLDKDTEVDDFGGEEGVDIEGNMHKLTVKHPVDLVHLAMKDGVVRLEGADNNVVRITLTEDGTLQLAAGAGVNLGNIVSMVANGSADLEISGDIEISDIKAYGRPGNKGTLSYVNMTTAGDYTIENMTITGSVIDVGEGTTLYLVNVDIKSDSHITDDPARVFAQNANIHLDKTNTWVDQEITAAQDTLLYMCGDTQRSITLAAGSEIVELTSSMFDSVTLTGTDLWLDMTGIAEATYNKDFFTLDFQDLARKMAKAQVDVENLHVYATLDGEKYTEAYSTANGGLTTTLCFQVPEPATGTLSLLALAALAARRKKK